LVYPNLDKPAKQINIQYNVYLYIPVITCVRVCLNHSDGHSQQCTLEISQINGHFRILDWRYLPYIFGLFFRPKFQGISPQNMARNMVLTYLHFRILKFPLI
jgi:hypothetical protein